MAFVKATNIVSTIIITTVALLGCSLITACEALAEKEWKTNCFSDLKHGKCEDSVIQIFSNHYSCDMVMEIDGPPTKIGFVNGVILVSNGTNTFYIRNEELQATNKMIFIPRWDEFIDNKLNKYFIKKGNAFMIDNQTQSQFEILTSEDRSNTHLAFDMNDKVVLILSFSPGDIAGSLYALDTDSIKQNSGKVQAIRVDGAGEDITAMVVEGGLDKLLLGIRTPEGGKIIRLTRQNQNPCSVNDEGKVAIVNLIEETKNKLLQIITDVYSLPPPLSNRLVIPNGGENPKDMETENKRLKRELFIANARLDSFTASLLTFKRNKQEKSNNGRSGIYHLRQEQQEHWSTAEEPIPVIYDDLPELSSEPEGLKIDTTVKPMFIPSKSGRIVQCISMEDFHRLNAEISGKVQANSELTAKFNELSDQMDNLLSIVTKPV